MIRQNLFMKSILSFRSFLILLILFSFHIDLLAQASCATAVDLTPVNCSSGNLQNAANAAPTGSCGGATSTTTFGVWYKFTASAATATITLSGIGTSLAYNTTYIEVLNDGVCGSQTAKTCQAAGTTAAAASPLSLSGLTIGTNYYIRLYVTTAPSGNAANKYAFSISLQQPPANDACTNPIVLTSSTTCTTITSTLSGATISSPAVSSTCSGSPGGDIWYSFVTQGTNSTITLSNIGSAFSTAGTYIQLLSGSCGSFTSLVCANGTSLTATGLTSGATYYVRIYSPTASPTGCNWNFDICVTYTPPPVNDDCTNATVLTSGTTCSNTGGTLAYATVSNPAVASTCSGGTPGADVWYQFVAQTTQVTISLGTIGTDFVAAGTKMQLLSGACGGFTSLACVSGSTNSLSLNTFTTGGITLVPGATYYIRVYSPTAAPSTGVWTYNICVSEITARVDFSRSYINITKGTTGGTVDVGDVLEMRATFVIRAKTVDSLSFIDTLYNTKGLKLVPGSIALRTNEGKIYGNTIGTTPSAFTDAFDADAGWSSTNGLDTIIHINFGVGATNFKRGQLTNTSKPSVYTNTCIVMATYRVVVYAPYNTKINFKTGALTYRDQATDAAGTANKVTFSTNSFTVYKSPGLCPNAVSASNALGAEFNGTFGTPSVTAPLARNRGTTPYTSYTYAPFTATGGPNDYSYGIANNTSQKFTTVNTWAKPDNNGYRVFNLWDITGDHTGASNATQGNPACDTTKPVSATNPCGYMLVINSAYKADTAFTYTVNNLCPNTYYELSAWFKNICYKCGCDSNGVGAGGTTNTGYIPTAPNDSSGVRPNIAFDVNGSDYYTTGDILYAGTTVSGPNASSLSDAANQWVKRGFTYLTGPTETTFTLTIRNNAPGGGGNDWALDDISVSTCLPNMQYSPTVNPVTCMDNVIKVQDTITSYFNNYNNYQWQISSDGGKNWNNLVGQSGTITPYAVSGGYQYITSYTIPPTATQAANNGDKYRVIVATTATNLPNTNCQLTDGVSIINLTVLSNCSVLPTKILSFSGKLVNDHAMLYWTTTREEEHLRYSIEKSMDGVQFTRIGILNSYPVSGEQNYYTFRDSAQLTGRAWYRIAMINPQNRTLYSRNIALYQELEPFAVTSVLNPFTNDILFDVALSSDAKLSVALYSISGKLIKQQSYTGYKGTNGLTLTDLKSLSKGMYLLQVQCNGQMVVKKVVKQ